MSLLIKDFFPDQLAITPDIQLSLISTKKFSQVPDISEFKIITFEVSGSAQGLFTCAIQSSLSDKNFEVFIESMNILLGNALTQIEEQSGFLLDLGSPHLESMNHFDISSKAECLYNLKIFDESFHCFIFNDLQIQLDQKIRTNTVSHQKEGASHA